MEHLLQTVAREVRQSLHGSGLALAGQCEGAAADVYQRLLDEGIDCQLVYGTHPSPHQNAVKGSIGHFWVRAGEFLVDPTIEQFGAQLPLVIRASDQRAGHYHAIEVVEESLSTSTASNRTVDNLEPARRKVRSRIF